MLEEGGVAGWCEPREQEGYLGQVVGCESISLVNLQLCLLLLLKLPAKHSNDTSTPVTHTHRPTHTQEGTHTCKSTHTPDTHNSFMINIMLL